MRAMERVSTIDGHTTTTAGDNKQQERATDDRAGDE